MNPTQILASQYATDLRGYANTKTAFMREIEAAAQTNQPETGP
jgi:hypothetical protein